LPLHAKSGTDDPGCCAGRIGATGHDDCILAAHLGDHGQEAPFRRLCGRDMQAHLVRSGKGDAARQFMLNEQLAGLDARAIEIVEHAGRNAGVA